MPNTPAPEPASPVASGTPERRSCPDDGRCHHACVSGCFRVTAASPLSGVFPNDRWPAAVVAEHGDYQTADDRDPYEAGFDAQIAGESR